MKKSIKCNMYRTTFILGAFLFVACGQMEKKEMPVETEAPAVEVASDEYAEIVKRSLDQMQKLDFDNFAAELTDDAEWLWPNGTAESRSVIKGKDSIISFWKNYKEMSGLKQMNFTNRNLMPLQVNRPTNYYNVTGSVVLYYGDIEAVYEKDTVSVRQHIVYAFNDDKMINRVFLYYDRSGWVALTGTVISSNE